MSVHYGGRGFGHVSRRARAVSGGGGGGGGGGFAYQRTITIDNSAGTAKTDYPVKVSLTSANFNFAHTQSDGRDIQFKSGATVLSHWVESWDAAGQTAGVWVKLPSIVAAASPTITMLYGDATAVSASDIHGTFIFGEDFSDIDRLIGYPDKDYPVRTGSFGVVLGNRVAGIAVASGVAGTWNETVREQASVIYDPLDANPAYRYKFYYTGQTLPSTSGDRHIGLSTSPDGKTWTAYPGNPVIGGGASTDRGEDPYVVRNIDGTVYRDASNRLHMFTEDQAQQDMLHYTSTDGITWTADPANPVIQRGTTGSYDDAIVASPIVLHLGGDNKFLMVYEARGPADAVNNTIGTTTEWTALARATSLMGKVWTKDPTNPVFAGDVPDDVVWTGTEWIYTYHNTANPPSRGKITGSDPWLWNNTSFANYGQQPLWINAAGGSYNAVPEGASKFGRRFTMQQNDTAAMDLYDVLGSDVWAFERLGASKDPEHAVINAKGDGVLVLDPALDNTSSSASYCAYTRQLSLTSNFAVMMRRKTELTTDDGWSQFGFGAGTASASGTFGYMDGGGYFFMVRDPGASNTTIRKYVGSTPTAIATNNVTAAEAQAFTTYQFSYLSTGALRVDVNGASRLSATDATHTALAKNLFISQGSVSTAPQGGKQTVDWVVVRNYDGQDPATSVGLEV